MAANRNLVRRRRAAGRAGGRVRLHERLPRRRELDRHRRLHRRAEAAAGGRVRRVLQRRRDLRLPPERRGDDRQGHRPAGRGRSSRHLRRAHRRDRLEPGHLVVRHPVELVARADRRHRRRGDRQGRRRLADRRGHLEDGALHLRLAAARLPARRAADGDRRQRLPARIAAQGRQLVPPPAAGLGRSLQPGPRRQRRAEDDRHHLAAADRLGLCVGRGERCRRPG